MEPEKPITNGSHADVIGNKPIFFMPEKKKRVEVGCTLSKIIINQETNRKYLSIVKINNWK